MPDQLVSVSGEGVSFKLYDGVDGEGAAVLQRRLANRPEADHGLRFTKFFGRWATEGSDLLEEISTGRRKNSQAQIKYAVETTQPLLDWLDPSCPNSNPPNVRAKGTHVTLRIGDGDRLTEATQRLKALAHQTLDVMLVSRLLTGIGLPHPTENGCLFHPTLAVPYLRGTALKQAARQGAVKRGAGADDLNRIFGTLSADGNGGVGSVVFLDGLPLTPMTLVAEQITPHYRGYYQGPNPALGIARDAMQSPADWYEPIPITLLAVEGSWEKPQRFRIGLRGPEGDVDLALDWLKVGLARFGFGARTTLGTGRMLTEECHCVETAARAATAQAAADQAAAEVVAQGPPVGTEIFWFGMAYRIIGRTPTGELQIESQDDREVATEPWDPQNMWVS